ncbi:MAG TPA: hypothetical protein VFL90_16705 [Methylomirabilota bacterium]|nr:hypothetical protein [Methylomirabilota bacterium]
MRRAALALALAVVLGGCAAEPVLIPPAGDVPDLRGTWTGTWGGAPLTLVVTEQGGTTRDSSVRLGPWPVSGAEFPTLGGVLTYQVLGRPVSANARGRFGDLNTWPSGYGLALVIDALTPDGEHLVLTEVTADRLSGVGTSIPRWGPQGPVELRINPAR